MKKSILAALLVVGLTAGFAFAHGNFGMGTYGGHMWGGGHHYGMMGGGGMGPGMMSGRGYGGGCPGVSGWGTGWSEENQQKFFEQTSDLRKQLLDKQFAYGEALRNPATTDDQLRSLEKEVAEIQTQLNQKAVELR